MNYEINVSLHGSHFCRVIVSNYMLVGNVLTKLEQTFTKELGYKLSVSEKVSVGKPKSKEELYQNKFTPEDYERGYVYMAGEVVLRKGTVFNYNEQDSMLMAEVEEIDYSLNPVIYVRDIDTGQHFMLQTLAYRSLKLSH